MARADNEMRGVIAILGVAFMALAPYVTVWPLVILVAVVIIGRIKP